MSFDRCAEAAAHLAQILRGATIVRDQEERKAVCKGIEALIGQAEEYPQDLIRAIEALWRLLRLRPLMHREVDTLCLYLRQVMALSATRELPDLPIRTMAPQAPPKLVSEVRFDEARTAQGAGIGLDDVAFLGVGLLGAALVVPTLGALGVAAAGSVGGGLLGQLASNTSTTIAKGAIDSGLNSVAESLPQRASPSKNPKHSRKLARSWMRKMGFTRLPDSYQELCTQHRRLTDRYRTDLRKWQATEARYVAIYGRWDAALAPCVALLPYRTFSADVSSDWTNTKLFGAGLFLGTPLLALGMASSLSRILAVDWMTAATLLALPWGGSMLFWTVKFALRETYREMGMAYLKQAPHALIPYITSVRG